MRRADHGDALLNPAASQLANLPAAVDTVVRPPEVVLDSSKRIDKQDVYAIAIRNPNVPDGPINIVSVPAGNAGFRGSFDVRSGDILKLFIVPDETVDEERRQAGLSRYLPMDFTIAQVLDDNMLLIEKGIPPAVAARYRAHLGAADQIEDPSVSGLLVPAKLEVWRNLDLRIREIDLRLGRYADRRLPRIGWEPSPDEQVLNQLVVWLNQWLRQTGTKVEWQREPLLDTLNTELLQHEQLQVFIGKSALSAEAFRPYDGRLLQEAVWLRDVARWAQGESFNDLDRATSLFDWTVRNMQLERGEESNPHRPWQVLLFGRGTAEERAWVFALLARQQGLDVVVLNGAGDGGKPHWLAGVLIEKELYLFDPWLGMPLPGPDGHGVATLQQVQQEDGLLRQLDLDEERYPLTAAALEGAAPQLVADHFSLSKRARQFESKLTGANQITLTSRPGEIAERLQSASGLGAPQLWQVPFRTLLEQLTLAPASKRLEEALAFEPFALRPLLWKARAHHFRGQRAAASRPTDEAIDDHLEAARLYQAVRPQRRGSAAAAVADHHVDALAKHHATYWLGLLSFDEQKYDVAEHWLSRDELSAKASRWAEGARYNLARTYEAQGKLEEAAALLEQDSSSPQKHGDRLRARMLRARVAAE